jgi:hypothetical protein
MSAEGKIPPATLGEEELARIKTVAAQVAVSANPARFQAELIAATRHQPNFAFLMPEHPHNDYYSYLVSVHKSYAGNDRQRAQAELQQANLLQQSLLARQQQQQQAAAAAAQQGIFGSGMMMNMMPMQGGFAVPQGAGGATMFAHPPASGQYDML